MKFSASFFADVYWKAHTAGLAAGNACVPTPMIVNRVDPVSGATLHTYAPVRDGVCGFAWVTIKGNTGFAKWAKSEGLVSKAYPTGLMFWVGQFNQSMTKKEAYAHEFAAVLNQYGIKAYAGSRMD